MGIEDKMYSTSFNIDGSRAREDQAWRLDRINMVIGYAQALADLDNKEDYYKKIVFIYDEKGTLYVKWKIRPTKSEKEYLQKAWESIVTDYEGNPIEHEYDFKE